jgi:outer membrane protein OmpA-like peptidoglycan-associated protein
MCGFSLMVCAGVLAVGCAIQDPPALTAIDQARGELQAAKEAGAHERFPDDYAALEKNYQLARGTFYACQDSKALAMAQTLVADAQALATKKVVVAAPPPPANQPPIAKLRVPSEGDLNSLLTFQADESTDPDGDRLSYRWNFGDGTSTDSSTGVGTHQYRRPGNYTVSLTVDDGRGGIDTATETVTVVSRQVLRGDVLFDANASTLKDKGIKELDKIVTILRRDTWLQAEVIGYTDSQGSEAYNLELSRKRAEAVAQYLQTHGVTEERLGISWEGEANPVAPNTTKEGRAQNRRTAITLRPASQ